MKKKVSGTHQAQLNAWRYEHIDGKHYNENTKAVPVVKSIEIVFILMVMTKWYAEILDIISKDAQK